MATKISKNVEPETRAFLEQVNAAGGKPLYELTPQEARAVLTSLQSGDVEKMPARIEDHAFSGGPLGTEVRLRIVRPADARGTLPAIVYLHGGGWVLGDENTHDRLVRELANEARAAVVFVKYSPAPEAQFPVQLEEALAVAKWVVENADAHDLDTSRLVVAGDSVGGNMATALAAISQAQGGPRFAFQLLFYPVTDASFETGSYEEFAEGHFLARESMKWFWDCYLPDASKRSDPRASPLRASLEQLRDLPPGLIIVGENDVLRDEGEAYAHKLAEAGVKVTATRFLGTIHDFVMLNPLAHTPAARGAIRLAGETLREVLGTRERGETAAWKRTGAERPATPPAVH